MTSSTLSRRIALALQDRFDESLKDPQVFADRLWIAGRYRDHKDAGMAYMDAALEARREWVEGVLEEFAFTERRDAARGLLAERLNRGE